MNTRGLGKEKNKQNGCQMVLLTLPLNINSDRIIDLLLQGYADGLRNIPQTCEICIIAAKFTIFICLSGPGLFQAVSNEMSYVS
jgi:hypothetical protein